MSGDNPVDPGGECVTFFPSPASKGVMPDAAAIPEPKLPDDVAVCHGMLRELLGTHGQLHKRIGHLEHQVEQLLKRLYGPRADKLHPDQGTLFRDPPEPAPVEVPPPPTPEVKPRKGHGRAALPANLRRETVIVDIPDAEKALIGGVWTKIGEEISEQLDYTPSSLFVRRTVRPKYVVRFATQADELRIADLPPQALPRCKAAPGLIADVVVAKLVDHLPLYRQEKRYARQGVPLSRSTLCEWMADTATVLAPLYALLKARVVGQAVVHTDDTPVPVQDPTREHCRTGRLWAYVADSGIVYDATPDRCRDGPLRFLTDFRGYLQCDAYAGYHELFQQGVVVEVGCWAHVRRKFVEAEKTSPALAHEAVARIRHLYAVEHAAQDLDPAGRAVLRQREAMPRLASLKEWLDRESRFTIPKSPIHEAMTYLGNQWTALTVYVTDGRLAIDNNRAERAVKPFAIGRKNWMFFGSDRGGRTLATLASFTATCELLGLNPWTWLRDTLTRLPLTPISQLDTLLPKPVTK